VSTLHDVLRRGDRTAAHALLAAHPEWVREPRALIGLAGLDDVDAMALLLELGADPNVEDPTRGRERPLHRAALAGARRAAELLLAHGAEVDPHETSHGATPLGFARWAGAAATIDLLRPISRDVWSLVQLGDVERLRALLTDEPTLARTATASGEALLMWLPDDEATARAIVELLLARGADPSIRAADGTTAPDRLRARGMDELAALLEPVDADH
jgi:ankyrin repeat protein